MVHTGCKKCGGLSYATCRCDSGVEVPPRTRSSCGGCVHWQRDARLTVHRAQNPHLKGKLASNYGNNAKAGWCQLDENRQILTLPGDCCPQFEARLRDGAS